MGIPLLDTMGSLPVPHDDGSWHSAEISRVIECIRDYSDKLDVRYIPQHLREEGDAAFAIVEYLPDGREVVAFYVQHEEDMNLSVLERIHGGDNAKHDVQKRMEAHNEAVRQLERKRREDALAEAKEEASFLFKLEKDSTIFNGKKIRL